MNLNNIKPLCFLISSFLLVVTRSFGGDETNLFYKVFAYGALIDPADPSAPPSNIDMKAELSSKNPDITWPPSSMAVMVIYDTDYLVARNTHSNLDRIYEVIQGEATVTRIVVESTVAAFKSRDIAELQKEKGVSKDALLELIRKGKSELISTARSVTSSGQEVIVRNVRHYLCPEGQVAESAASRAAESDSATTPKGEASCETGYILSVVPERSIDGLINLMVKSEWIDLEKWEKHDVLLSAEAGAKVVCVKKPVLDSSVVETQLKIASGETVLLGGGKTTSGDRVMYHFFKAEVTSPERVRKSGVTSASAQR